MRGSRRDALIDVLVDLAVKAGAAGGFLLGAFCGLQGHPRAAECPEGEACVGASILSAVWSVAAPAFAGAAAGLLAALLLVVLLRQATRRRAG